MGDILFQNTLTGRKEPFVPLHPGQVRMYTCGPTVYDFAHIGNFRTFVFQDILRRFLRSRGFEVIQVTNFTDVDDRIITKAAEARLDIRDFTAKYIEAFLADQRVLGIKKPEFMVRATDHIEHLVQLIERLTAKGFTYVSDGSVFVRCWVHAEHVLVDSQKMSKSLGNCYTLGDWLERGDRPPTLGFLLASGPDRRQHNDPQEGLQPALSSVERLGNFATRLNR